MGRGASLLLSLEFSLSLVVPAVLVVGVDGAVDALGNCTGAGGRGEEGRDFLMSDDVRPSCVLLFSGAECRKEDRGEEECERWKRECKEGIVASSKQVAEEYRLVQHTPRRARPMQR